MTTYERLTPTDLQLSAFAQGPQDEPVALVSLLRFRARAAYPRDYQGAKADVTGEEAYRRFDEIARRRIEAIGGRVIWAAPSTMTLAGPPNERWDEIVLVQLPRRAAFDMLQSDPEYEAAQVHLTAALAETRIFICKQA